MSSLGRGGLLDFGLWSLAWSGQWALGSGPPYKSGPRLSPFGEASKQDGRLAGIPPLSYVDLTKYTEAGPRSLLGHSGCDSGQHTGWFRVWGDTEGTEAQKQRRDTMGNRLRLAVGGGLMTLPPS